MIHLGSFTARLVSVVMNGNKKQAAHCVDDAALEKAAVTVAMMGPKACALAGNARAQQNQPDHA